MFLESASEKLGFFIGGFVLRLYLPYGIPLLS